MANDETNDRLSDLEDDSKDHEQRIAALEIAVGVLFEKFHEDFDKRIAALESQLTVLKAMADRARR